LNSIPTKQEFEERFIAIKTLDIIMKSLVENNRDSITLEELNTTRMAFAKMSGKRLEEYIEN
jgi:hypothetical protein